MQEFDVNNLISKDTKTIENGGGEEKRKGGRPKLALKEKKSKRVMAYFTEDEHEALMNLIKNSGISLSNFVRMSALAKLKE